MQLAVSMHHTDVSISLLPSNVIGPASAWTRACRGRRAARRVCALGGGTTHQSWMRWRA